MMGRVLWARLRAIFRADRTAQFDEELACHRDLLAAEYESRGMDPREARAAATRELGNATALREEYRDQNGLPFLENRWHDLKFSLRTLRRNPAFAWSCVATLAVGLGSVTTVLCVVSTLLWQPLPYPAPDRLVEVRETDPRNGTWPFSEPAVLDLAARSQSLAAVTAYRTGPLAMTGAGDAETVRASAVTPSFFRMFGVSPIAGRAFAEGEKGAVIDRGLWRRNWQMSEGVVGRSIALDGESYTIVGIADLPGDLFPGTGIVYPLAPKATESRTAHDIEVVGRLKPGVEAGPAQAEIASVAAAIARENPRTGAGWSMRLMPLADFVLGPRTKGTLRMVFAAVAMLWLLACANVAGLQMARSISRRHEMNTRLALGATKGRILGQTLTESLVLALAGGLIGLEFAHLAILALQRYAAEDWPGMAHVRMTLPSLALAAAFLLASTLLSALFTGRSGDLKGGRAISRRGRGRDVLIVAQVALASVLLLGAGLLFHSFLQLEAVDPGFDPDRILTVHVSLPGRNYDAPRRVAFFRDALSRVSALPEVESAGATNVTPFSGEGTANRFRVEGSSDPAEFHAAAWRAVTPGFFTTLGLPLKRGRLFTNADVDGAPDVVILSESMARKFWPGGDAIGKRLLWGRSGSPKTIVGVVGDLRDLAVDAAPEPTMFRPFAQLSDAPMTLLLRTRQDPAAAAGVVRGQIRAIDPDAALDFQSLRQSMSRSILRPRASLTIMAAFALVALITAALGLYGLIGYRVNQRQQEIGMRLALGASAGSVRWSVQRQCLTLVCAGLAIGLPLAYGLSTLMASLLYQTHPAEAAAYAMVLAVFAGVAILASYGPARRASRLDPMVAIRHE